MIVLHNQLVGEPAGLILNPIKPRLGCWRHAATRPLPDDELILDFHRSKAVDDHPSGKPAFVLQNVAIVSVYRFLDRPT